eukprot:CAMPEP_0202969138 /NCGR_PEP_ID=MMETSP1396-20130829/14775_1 /ASSEMBLY_ACC=CAM_ASM_000872 /TAXON_ID= /ORGANISM="Pseudokeronopsis sp., Strain Brazil" /LENGTH=64 /DNA_ID=CAMNT_0049696333 /DNA_START=702 /DNA_END=896 /DNA_ORIENTATION=+
MAHVGSQALPIRHHIPNLHRPIMAGGKEEVACLWEELDLLDALVVADPGVDPLLGDETLMLFLS